MQKEEEEVLIEPEEEEEKEAKEVKGEATKEEERPQKASKVDAVIYRLVPPIRVPPPPADPQVADPLILQEAAEAAETFEDTIDWGDEAADTVTSARDAVVKDEWVDDHIPSASGDRSRTKEEDSATTKIDPSLFDTNTVLCPLCQKENVLNFYFCESCTL